MKFNEKWFTMYPTNVNTLLNIFKTIQPIKYYRVIPLRDRGDGNRQMSMVVTFC